VLRHHKVLVLVQEVVRLVHHGAWPGCAMKRWIGVMV
jgi:hypothetical protein